MAEQVFRCENCGGILEFDAASQSLKCPNCDTVVSIQAGKGDVVEHSFTKQAVRTYAVQEKRSNTMKCSGCGATIEVDSFATATRCPYCGSSYVLADRQEEAIIPDGVIPFQIDKHRAQEIFMEWLKKRHFAPSNLKHLYQEGGIQGRYIPFWTFDADCDAMYQAMGGMNRVIHERDSEGNERTRIETDWYPTQGNVSRSFDDILVRGTENFKASLVKGMDSYDTHEVKPYAPEYFSGYLSERYTVDLETAHGQATDEMNETLREMATQDVLSRFDQVRDVSLRARYGKETYKHIIVPMYAASYSYKNKNYTVLINGQNGEVKGEYPKSVGKISLLVAVVVLLLLLLFLWTRPQDEDYAMTDAAQYAYEGQTWQGAGQYAYEGQAWQGTGQYAHEEQAWQEEAGIEDGIV